MKTIGMLGGMSWQSTASYYRLINQHINQRLGGLHSAKICLQSVNFDEIEKLQHQGDWDETARILSHAAKSIQAGGADFLIICTNTMHKVAAQIESSINIPLLHIADSTGRALVKDNIQKVALLGTRFTMQQDFYKKRLTDKFDIQVIVPSETEQTVIHDIIYNELCLGKIEQSSKQKYLTIIENLFQQGAQAIILGCTEIALLVEQNDTHVPLYDTTEIHVLDAVEKALKQSQ